MSNEEVSPPSEFEELAFPVPADQEETIEVLMARYQDADPAAARTLIAILTPVLFRFFRYHGIRLNEAEDLAQETWLRIHRARHTFRSREPLLPWIFTIARRARVDHFRRNLRTRIHEISSGVLPEAALARVDTGMLPSLSTLIATLPAAQRDVIFMLKAEGMSIEEVARATSSTPGAVKQRAHRAYRKLRDLLQAAPGQSPRRRAEA